MRRFVDDIEWNYLECPLCEQLGATEPQDSTNAYSWAINKALVTLQSSYKWEKRILMILDI